LIILPLVFLPKKYEFSRYKGILVLVTYMVFVFLAL